MFLRTDSRLNVEATGEMQFAHTVRAFHVLILQAVSGLLASRILMKLMKGASGHKK